MCYNAVEAPVFSNALQKKVAFRAQQVYTISSYNRITDSSGQGAIPYRRYSPRADVFDDGRMIR